MRTQLVWPSIGRTAVGNQDWKKFVLQEDRERGASWDCLSFHRQAQLSTLPIRKRRRHEKMARRQTQLSLHVVEKLKKKIDPEEPTPLIDQVCLGCTHRASVTRESNVKSKSGPSAKSQRPTRKLCLH